MEHFIYDDGLLLLIIVRQKVVGSINNYMVFENG